MIACLLADISCSTFEGMKALDNSFDPVALLGPEAKSPSNLIEVLKQRPWVPTAPAITDDSVLTLALYKAASHGLDPASCLRDFGRKYEQICRGFGSGFSEWLRNPTPGYRGASVGNGALMRLGFIPFMDWSLLAKIEFVTKATRTSHNSEQALWAVTQYCLLTHKLRSLSKAGCSLAEAHQDIKRVLKDLAHPLASSGLAQLASSPARFETRAVETWIQSLIIVSESNSLSEIRRNALWVGGDVDTLAVIASSIGQCFMPSETNAKNLVLKHLDAHSELASLIPV